MANLLVREFPDDLHHALKTAALAQRVTLREYVIAQLSSKPVESEAKKRPDTKVK